MKATIASLALACGTAVATLRDPNVSAVLQYTHRYQEKEKKKR